MTALLVEATLRSSVVLLAGILLHGVLTRQSAATRHRTLAAALLAAALVIPLSAMSPGWALFDAPVLLRVEAGLPEVATSESAVARERASVGGSSDGSDALLWAWAGGVAASLAILLIGLMRLALLTRSGRRVSEQRLIAAAADAAARIGVQRRFTLIETDAPDVLATWGLVSPCVLLPTEARTWTDDRRQAVLRHELAHIRRHDWLVQVGTDLFRAVFWFNPLVWAACARLRRDSEHACDDAVLATGTAARDYARHLVEIAVACRRGAPRLTPLLPMARPSTLEGRITAMLNPHVNRQPLSRRAAVLLLAGLLALTIPLAGLRLAAQGGPGTLTGYVYDTSGGVLPAAEVTLIDAQEVKWPTTTDSSGRFEFTPVGNGTYTLEISLPGFRTLRHAFTLADASSRTRAFTMQVGELEETITVTARRPEPRPAATGGAGDAMRIGGNIKPPLKLQDVRPVYPESMRAAGLEGIVPMEALIGLDGTVTSVRVLSAQVHPEFAAAAERAVRQWLFSPTLLNGAPVEVRMAVSVQFSLAD